VGFAFASESIAAPLSLSSMDTVPEANELPALPVVAVKAE
jgi:hypothetical protein